MATKPLPTFILHGWSKETVRWQPFITQLKKYRLRPVLLKIPGLTAPLNSVWHLEDYVAWLSQTIGHHKHINLIAHSFGGRIAIKFDTKYPKTIQKLVLIDSAGIKPSSLPAILKRISFKAVAKLGKKITQNPQARKLLYKLAREQDYLQADKTLRQTLANIVSQDQRADLPYVTAHTLIIWGANDTITPLSDGRLMHKNITGSRLEIIDQAKHSPHFTHPEEVATLIKEFLHQ